MLEAPNRAISVCALKQMHSRSLFKNSIVNQMLQIEKRWIAYFSYLSDSDWVVCLNDWMTDWLDDEVLSF